MSDLYEPFGTKIAVPLTEQRPFGGAGAHRCGTNSEHCERGAVDRARAIDTERAGAADHREVAVAPGRLFNRESAATIGDREADGDEQFIGLETRCPCAQEEITSGDRARTVLSLDVEDRVERQGDGRILRCGVGVCERTTNGTARANLEMTDQRSRPGQ